MPWRSFLDWLIGQISESERIHHKTIPRRLRGWPQDLLQKFKTRAKQLLDADLMEIHDPFLPAGLITETTVRFLPEPFLEQVKSRKNQQCFVAYLVSGRVYSELVRTGVSPEALRQRIREFRRRLKGAGVAETDLVEREWALFRFYDLQPGVGKQITADLPPLSGPPWAPQLALTDWEREQIAQICAE